MVDGDPETTRSTQEAAWRAAEGEHLLVVGIGASAGGLEALERFLRQVAHDGPAGIATGREFRPDVILCDIGLPGMSRYELARAARGEPSLHGAFLVALTGYAAPDDQRRAADARFDAHLAKPPTIEQILGAIARAP